MNFDPLKRFRGDTLDLFRFVNVNQYFQSFICLFSLSEESSTKCAFTRHQLRRLVQQRRLIYLNSLGEK